MEHSKASSLHPSCDGMEGESDDDNAHSIVTVIPHELEHVEEEDKEQLHLTEKEKNDND